MTPIAAKLKRFLLSHRVDYRLYCHSRTYRLEECAQKHGMSGSAFAKTIVVKDKKNYWGIVVPLYYEIDFPKLNNLLKREVYVVCHEEADKLFDDCEPLSHPPLGSAYHLDMVVDARLLNNKTIFFEAGSHTSIIGLEKSDFCYLMADATWGQFSRPIPDVQTSVKKNTLLSAKNTIHRESRAAKPPHFLPEIVNQIIVLSHQPDGSPEKLMEILKNDRRVSAVLQDYNEQRVYIEKQALASVNPSLKKSLKHWLDFSAVSHVVLDLSSHSQFKIDAEGPLGLPAFWRHATFCAKLCSQIAQDSSLIVSVDPFLCYLGGLLHNFGLLFIGHLYTPEFRLLNRWFSAHPNESIKQLEKKLIGLGGAQQLMSRGHDKIGSWVMRYWGMPSEIQLMAKHHHALHYNAKHHEYVNILLLANTVLREHAIGEGEKLEDADLLASKLGITKDRVEFYLAQIIDEGFSMPVHGKSTS
ncbi:HDOD domain-containing protein [Candidatus Berkiella cookevillensis]|uniref:HDOD domain protein n=1 Tax=Candidatus Berkiella cookevillensis TaxID=437022 RepID=A0A0Q9YK34_9GAMM|nr:HDOD domain-containing protein [Candidatus Berkiella cookevillensis]MCS5708301.1 HDOD domain-containing protein [Candidatus Berkiella cookevillensis]